MNYNSYVTYLYTYMIPTMAYFPVTISGMPSNVGSRLVFKPRGARCAANEELRIIAGPNAFEPPQAAQWSDAFQVHEKYVLCVDVLNAHTHIYIYMCVCYV